MTQQRYGVIGNPIAHSQSPWIHQAFAIQTGLNIDYQAYLADLDQLCATLQQLLHSGLRGCNITVPFKQEAFSLAHTYSDRALQAGAVNTLLVNGAHIHGDNTDGIGLVRDLNQNLQQPLQQQRILVIGAGGAARGIVPTLLAQQPAQLVIANRTAATAIQWCNGLTARYPHYRTVLSAQGFEQLEQEPSTFNLIINATSASLEGSTLPIPSQLFTNAQLVYDLMYAASDTPFLQQAMTAGAPLCQDGLGMLVEQAAESFYLWTGIMPDSATVLAALRTRLRDCT